MLANDRKRVGLNEETDLKQGAPTPKNRAASKEEIGLKPVSPSVTIGSVVTTKKAENKARQDQKQHHFRTWN
jgi:hypothetical protein